MCSLINSEVGDRLLMGKPCSV